MGGLKIFFDGGCRPNPGEMETAVVARGLLYHRACIGRGTSHRAEWHALLHALDVAADIGARDIVLVGDAKAVIDQAQGRAGCREDGLMEAYRDRAAGFARVRLRYVRRGQNLAGIALGLAKRATPDTSRAQQDTP